MKQRRQAHVDPAGVPVREGTSDRPGERSPRPLGRRAASLALRLAGGVTAWLALWIALGIGPVIGLAHQPHPWVKASATTPILLHALLEWLGRTCAVYAGAGLAASALVEVLRGQGPAPERPFRTGLEAGLGVALILHGFLYGLVPLALAETPLLNHLPIGLVLGLLLGGGAAFAWRALAPRRPARRGLALGGLLLVLALLPHVPHDLLRRGRRTVADPTAPRLVLVSFDALRRDVLEQVRPDWAQSPEVQTVTPFPATRLAWDALLGGNPDEAFGTWVAPSRWEVEHPEHLTLLVAARRKSLPTAFAINDSLSPCYGLQPTLFDKVLTPEGGWKYWLTYGHGGSWPVYSWLQNLLSPVETSNPWNDLDAWFRDIEGLLDAHRWVSSHNCLLHPPMRLRAGELQALDPWRWPFHSALAYLPYESLDDMEADTRHWRGTWRSDGKTQYEVRVRRLVKEVEPWLERWKARYAHLSGMLMSDHGESFEVYQAQGKTPIHSSGHHGFGLQASTLSIPLHPFGESRNLIRPGEVSSLLDLRDAIGVWIEGGRPLALRGRTEGWAIHLQRVRQGTTAAPDAAKGILPGEIAGKYVLAPNGFWFQEGNRDAHCAVSSALVAHGDMEIYNVEDTGGFSRQVVHRGRSVGQALVSPQTMRRAVDAFQGSRVLERPFR